MTTSVVDEVKRCVTCLLVYALIIHNSDGSYFTHFLANDLSSLQVWALIS
jgi:hypothetical protein